MAIVDNGAQRASTTSHRLADLATGVVRRLSRIWLAATIIALVGSAAFSTGPSSQAVAAEGRLKAAIIVGPTHGMTATYKRWAEVIARTAERNGMDVRRVYSPNATWTRVKDATRNANLVVYLGHGFGYPSPYPHSLFESQMDGFGLNYPDRRTNYATHYYGADRIRDSLKFAPNSIVILNHLCYSAGHGEMHHSRPTRATALKRVDNFANGFLDAGASTVFALAFQPAETIVNALFNGRRNTMEDLFRKRFSTGGWNGHSPSRHESRRTPGADILLDPSRTQSYRRAITGDLQMTAGEWRSGAQPSGETPQPEPEPDTTAPDLTGVTASAGGETVDSTQTTAVPFSPNDDGLADKVTLGYTVSEAATVDFTVRDETGLVVRELTAESGPGSGTLEWDGTAGDGSKAPEGRYEIRAVARDARGNASAERTVAVRVFSVIRGPRWDTDRIDPDGDDLAERGTYTVNLERQATVTIEIRDASGQPVATLANGELLPAGPVERHWNGQDANGDRVPQGIYTAFVRAEHEFGAERAESSIRVTGLQLTRNNEDLRRGDRVRFRVTSTEPLADPPTIRIKQPNLAGVTLEMSPGQAADTYYLGYRLSDRGGRGEVIVTVTATDQSGGSEQTVERYRIR